VCPLTGHHQSYRTFVDYLQLYSQQHIRVYKTGEFLQLIFNLNHLPTRYFEGTDLLGIFGRKPTCHADVWTIDLVFIDQQRKEKFLSDGCQCEKEMDDHLLAFQQIL
jgi:hypothetical protein